MKSTLLLACGALLAGMSFAGPPRAQGAAPEAMRYALASPQSQFTWGCFAPCMCPIMIASSFTGSFTLRFSHADPLFAYYDVVSVSWEYPAVPAPVGITGSGTYRVGGEFALVDQLTLDLSFAGAPAQHFDSGLKPVGAAFPAISTSLSLHGEFCFDSVLAVLAKPVGTAGVGGGLAAPGITAAPNPFTGESRILFTLPRAGPVDLDVIDLAGRRVRALAHGQWCDAGEHSLAWDGRRERGIAAAPGLYLVRLLTPSGRVTRTLVKLW